jgi:hypothetical protein
MERQPGRIEMSRDTETGLFIPKQREAATGRVVLTPDGPQPYKVVFKIGERLISEHPVATIREGEALLREELAEVQFTAREERPHPQAPKRSRPAPVA